MVETLLQSDGYATWHCGDFATSCWRRLDTATYRLPWTCVLIKKCKYQQNNVWLRMHRVSKECIGCPKNGKHQQGLLIHYRWTPDAFHRRWQRLSSHSGDSGHSACVYTYTYDTCAWTRNFILLASLTGQAEMDEQLEYRSAGGRNQKSQTHPVCASQLTPSSLPKLNRCVVIGWGHSAPRTARSHNF